MAPPQENPYENVRSIAGTWIGSADIKATAIIAVGGALLTVVAGVVAMANGIGSFGNWGIRLFFGFCLSIAISIGASATALFPRTDRRRVLKTAAGWDPIPKSPSFFGDVASLTKADFENLLNNADLRIADSMEQAFVTCRIATTKMTCLKLSVGAIVGALAFLLALLLVIAFGGSGATVKAPC